MGVELRNKRRQNCTKSIGKRALCVLITKWHMQAGRVCVMYQGGLVWFQFSWHLLERPNKGAGWNNAGQV